MHELALFAGAGGSCLAGQLLGWTTVCAVELDPYCREVLLQRQRDGVLQPFPVWDDVRTFDGRPWRGCVDIVTAGPPCQPWSRPGLRRGAADARNRWPDTLRILREVGPRYALLEGVPAFLADRYFGEVLGALADMGFDARWSVLGGSMVGCPAEGRRLWIVAAKADGGDGSSRVGVQPPDEGPVRAEDDRQRLRAEWWKVEPPRGDNRMDHGMAHRMDRLRALGNGWCPALAAAAWLWLTYPYTEGDAP